MQCGTIVEGNDTWAEEACYIPMGPVSGGVVKATARSNSAATRACWISLRQSRDSFFGKLLGDATSSVEL